MALRNVNIGYISSLAQALQQLTEPQRDRRQDLPVRRSQLCRVVAPLLQLHAQLHQRRPLSHTQGNDCYIAHGGDLLASTMAIRPARCLGRQRGSRLAALLS